MLVENAEFSEYLTICFLGQFLTEIKLNWNFTEEL